MVSIFMALIIIVASGLLGIWFDMREYGSPALYWMLGILGGMMSTLLMCW